ncbi:hypothetical protein SPOG_00095 [Schizosaccharomyces cryophilus OY26]|uniref:Uncharacterized protein n=1 Tax=Schizosaccharomyces cryophilus (strain OY26 / ATCC MYA-4695 / CBS 11777 / NBRC 106824 / NRRL Y48691) TaxID=653667 RepID=S9W0U8_SCHCR|nr:uncharacterized protein SPOG_00095 [Schizosaccharomyces cryophilus OY26]EPY51670.1 hypothetical protein SPOG_00095 [Schizosaccharomyces cryophilus OY26]
MRFYVALPLTSHHPLTWQKREYGLLDGTTDKATRQRQTLNCGMEAAAFVEKCKGVMSLSWFIGSDFFFLMLYTGVQWNPKRNGNMKNNPWVPWVMK